ncbi:MAG: helix-turn-helix domain-containing protein [Clostridia bacterium]|nr:helix-turn-helix domain-containing protein [Clostridia bacterium]
MFFQPALLNDETFDVRISKMESYPLHWHSDLEILCCIEGTMNLSVEKTEYTVDKGDVILVGSCEPHEVGECTPDATVIEIRLGSLFCGTTAFKEIIKKRFEMPMLKNDTEAINEVRHIFSLLTDERSYKGDLEIRGRLYLLLTILLKKLSTTMHMSEKHKKRLAITMRMQKALDLVATRYSEEISLDEAAAVSGYEKSAFCRMFKTATDTTFHKYLNDYRIKKAMVLMEDNHCSIAEISTMVGFSQQKNFSRLFKSSVGVSPSEYRRIHLLDVGALRYANFKEK